MADPNASVAIAATRAESIPPDKPKTTPGNLFIKIILQVLSQWENSTKVIIILW